MKSNGIQEYFARLVSDDELYFYEALKIVEFGTKKLIPFRLNLVQKILHEMAEKQLKDDDHIRMIVLKARRFGISTYVQARFFKKCATQFNKNVHIATHDRATSDTMFGMARVMEQNYPKVIKPELMYSGKRELTWAADEGGGLNSRYKLSSVAGAEVRGDAIDYLHCSEVSSWGENAGDFAIGLQNCVLSGFKTEVWLESTAKGVGNFFYDEFWRAWRGESGFRAVFFPWFIFPDYKRSLTTEESDSDKFLNSLGSEKRYGGSSESDLLGYSKTYDTDKNTYRFEIGLEQLKWRRMTIDTQCQGDILMFNQEYPVTEESAFISSGRSVFDLMVLNRMQLKINESYENRPPDIYHVPVNEFKHRSGGIYEDKKMKYYLDPDNLGNFEVWVHPAVDREYRIGCDVSEGIEVSNRDTDYSTVCVIDAETLEQCSLWRGKIDPDLLAWVLSSIGKYYNEALIGVERNNHGLTTLTALRNIHQYPNIYFEKVLDERSQRRQKKIGWNTTLKSKPLLVNNLRELIREEDIEVHSKDIIHELSAFVHHTDGKMGAQAGNHDDSVIALGIAVMMSQLHPPSRLSLMRKREKHQRSHIPMMQYN